MDLLKSAQRGRAALVTEMKARQSMKIREIGQALIAAGFFTLDEQTKALGVPRSTAWTILQARHKNYGLSEKLIKRMLASQHLPPLVRSKIIEYREEKTAGLYGGPQHSEPDLSQASDHAYGGSPARRSGSSRSKQECSVAFCSNSSLSVAQEGCSSLLGHERSSDFKFNYPTRARWLQRRGWWNSLQMRRWRVSPRSPGGKESFGGQSQREKVPEDGASGKGVCNRKGAG
jgi:hypothetical protein